MSDEKTKKTTKKGVKAVKIIAIVLAVIIVLQIFVGYFLYSFMLRTDSLISRDTIVNMLVEQTGISTQFFGLNKDSIAWFNENGEDEHLTSEDGLKLHGKFFENPNANHKYAVVCHGYSANGRQMVGFVQEFLKMNYSVLTPDSRAHGESEGKKIGMGYFEQNDLLLWINSIVEKDPQAQIVLLGVSMGGATVLMESGLEGLPSNVKAVIADCPYTDAYQEFCSQMTDVVHLPAYPYVQIASVFCRMLSGYNFKNASPLESVKNSSTPTLFIHGEADAFVPFEMQEPLFEAATCEKEKLSVPNAAHGNSAGTDTELYWSTVQNFLAKYVTE